MQTGILLHGVFLASMGLEVVVVTHNRVHRYAVRAGRLTKTACVAAVVVTEKRSIAIEHRPVSVGQALARDAHERFERLKRVDRWANRVNAAVVENEFDGGPTNLFHGFESVATSESLRSSRESIVFIRQPLHALRYLAATSPSLLVRLDDSGVHVDRICLHQRHTHVLGAAHVDDSLTLLLLQEVVDEQSDIKPPILRSRPHHILHRVPGVAVHRMLGAVIGQSRETDFALSS